MYFGFTAFVAIVVFAFAGSLVGEATDGNAPGYLVALVAAGSAIAAGVAVMLQGWFDARATKERHKQRGQDMLVREVAAHTRAMREAQQASIRG